MTPPPQTLVDYNAQYNKWVKDSPIATGSSNSCNAASKYEADDVKFGDDGADRYYDYYFCDDKEKDEGLGCRGWTWEEWNTTWGNCQKALPSNRIAPNTNDKCVNMVTKDTPWIMNFDMGWGSNSSNIFNPIKNSGCDECLLDSDGRLGANPANYAADGMDTNAYDSGLSSEVLFSKDVTNEMDNCGTCRMSGVSGMRPAYPTSKSIIQTLSNKGELNSTFWVGGLDNCPTGFTRDLYCALDGHDNAVGSDAAPGCGFGDDTDEDSLARFCARDPAHYTDDNIAECCLEREEDSSHFKTCPRDYCVSTKVPYASLTTEEKAKCIPESDEEGNSYCRQMNDSCNNFFKEKCSVDVFNDPNTEGNLHEKCNTWAHIMPAGFNSVADRVCNIAEDIDLEGTDGAAISKRLHIKELFKNPLCRDYIKRNLPTYVDRLTRICEPAVRKEGEDWVKTDYGKNMEDICPCYYPQEYNEWYKQKHFEGDDDVSSSMSLQVKPECYMPECQRTLLYDTSGITGNCPSLQVCANKIAAEISVSESGEIDTSSAHVGDIECNFSSVVQVNNRAVTDLTSSGGGTGGSTGGGTGGGTGGSTGRGSTGGGEEEGDNTLLIVGGIIFCIIICIILFFVISGGGEGGEGGK